MCCFNEMVSSEIDIDLARGAMLKQHCVELTLIQ